MAQRFHHRSFSKPNNPPPLPQITNWKLFVLSPCLGKNLTMLRGLHNTLFLIYNFPTAATYLAYPAFFNLRGNFNVHTGHPSLLFLSKKASHVIYYPRIREDHFFFLIFSDCHFTSYQHLLQFHVLFHFSFVTIYWDKAKKWMSSACDRVHPLFDLFCMATNNTIHNIKIVAIVATLGLEPNAHFRFSSTHTRNS